MDDDILLEEPILNRGAEDMEKRAQKVLEEIKSLREDGSTIWKPGEDEIAYFMSDCDQEFNDHDERIIYARVIELVLATDWAGEF